MSVIPIKYVYTNGRGTFFGKRTKICGKRIK